MKKIRRNLAVMLRTAILLSPGVAAALVLGKGHGWPVAILAGLGVELVAGVLITYGTVVAAQLKAQRMLRREANANADGAHAEAEQADK